MSQPTGQVVCDCFPLLQGTSIVGAGGVEDVTPVCFLADKSLAVTTIATMRSTTKAMAAEGEDDDSDDVEVFEERSSKQRGKE